MITSDFNLINIWKLRWTNEYYTKEGLPKNNQDLGPTCIAITPKDIRIFYNYSKLPHAIKLESTTIIPLNKW